MRNILARGPLSCHSSGPPLSAGLKMATVMDKYILLWDSNLSDFTAFIGEYCHDKICLKPVR